MNSISFNCIDVQHGLTEILLFLIAYISDCNKIPNKSKAFRNSTLIIDYPPF